MGLPAGSKNFKKYCTALENFQPFLKKIACGIDYFKTRGVVTGTKSNLNSNAKCLKLEACLPSTCHTSS
jgi:hypothetical protein